MKNHTGNVLFLILIAVALFAALSYAITSSTRTSSDSPSKELTSIGSASVINTIGGYKPTVEKLLLRGCSPSEISFQNDILDGHVNPNSPVDNSCHVFHPDGGGAILFMPNDKILDSVHSANARFGEISFERNTAITILQGRTSYMVEATIPFVKESVCQQINNKLFNIDTIPTNTTASVTRISYSGSFSFGTLVQCSASPLGGSVCGDLLGCYRVNSIWGSTQPAYVLYAVVLSQ